MCKQRENRKTEIGRFGEKLAASYLKRNRYKILKTNISYPWGEIDIIAKDSKNMLVFIEVKSLDQRGQLEQPGQLNGQDLRLRPEDNLTRPKLSRLMKSCSFFANDNPELADNGWRIDLVALTISDKNYDIRHLENIG